MNKLSRSHDFSHISRTCCLVVAAVLLIAKGTSGASNDAAHEKSPLTFPLPFAPGTPRHLVEETLGPRIHTENPVGGRVGSSKWTVNGRYGFKRFQPTVVVGF